MPIAKRLAAEFLGTFWLVFGGCGSAIFAAVFLTPDKVPVGIGFAGVGLAFGLTVLTGVYALGPISGGHFNPAVTVGLWVGRRFDGKDVIPYVIVQCVAAICAAAVLFLIVSGKTGFAGAGNFAANGYGDHSPGGYNLVSCFVAEVVLTFFFLAVILGSTDRRAPAGFAGLAIGLCLTLIHFVDIPITNASVNPARSLGPALFAQGGWAIPQLWLFWVAPLIGAAIAGIVYSQMFAEKGTA
ncbi:MAG TPA: aquaporin Z [Candidatus Tumulicola sp.]|nr:aquaporin Z [Candidatus Tumulicola sp.]